jgi:hypothetical protein
VPKPSRSPVGDQKQVRSRDSGSAPTVPLWSVPAMARWRQTEVESYRSASVSTVENQQLLSLSSCGTATAMLRPQWLTVDGSPSTYRMSRPTLFRGRTMQTSRRPHSRAPTSGLAGKSDELVPTATADAPSTPKPPSTPNRYRSDNRRVEKCASRTSGKKSGIERPAQPARGH